MVDGLGGLGHHAVVRRHHEHHDVGHLGTTCAHLGKRGVSRGVDERDRSAVVGDLVGTDVLRNAAGLAGNHVGVADLVEQRGLAVVDVTHDSDHGRAGLLQRLDLVVAVVKQRLELQLFLLAGLDEQDLCADLECEQFHLLVGKRHGRRDHLAVLQQEANEVRRRAVDLGRELLGRHAALDNDRALGNGSIIAGVIRAEMRLQLVHVTTTTSATLLGRTTLTAGATATTGTTGTATGATGATTGTTGTLTESARATGSAAGTTRTRSEATGTRTTGAATRTLTESARTRATRGTAGTLAGTTETLAGCTTGCAAGTRTATGRRRNRLTRCRHWASATGRRRDRTARGHRGARAAGGRTCGTGGRHASRQRSGGTLTGGSGRAHRSGPSGRQRTSGNGRSGACSRIRAGPGALDDA